MYHDPHLAQAYGRGMQAERKILSKTIAQGKRAQYRKGLSQGLGIGLFVAVMILASAAMEII